MKINTNTLLPNTTYMVHVAAVFLLLAVCLGLIFGAHTTSEPFPLLAYMVWELSFVVIFAIIYVVWLIYYAVNAYTTQAQAQKMTALQRGLDGTPEQ